MDEIEFYKLICPDNYQNLYDYVLAFSYTLGDQENLSKASLVYLIRFVQSHNLRLEVMKNCNINVMITVSIVIAYKFMSDDDYMIDGFRKVSRKLLINRGFDEVSLDELKRGELEFLKFINWECYVDDYHIKNVREYVMECCDDWIGQ